MQNNLSCIQARSSYQSFHSPYTDPKQVERIRREKMCEEETVLNCVAFIWGSELGELLIRLNISASHCTVGWQRLML